MVTNFELEFSYALNIILFCYELIIIPMGIFLFLHIPMALLPHAITEIKPISSYPKVSIVIPTFFPSILALEANFRKIKDISYPNIEIIVVDNSPDLKIVKNIEKLSKEYNVQFFHRKQRAGFKSGNINHVLYEITGKYIFFIDIDQIIIPGSIQKFVAFLEQNENYAFVQAKYKIMNDNSLIRIANAIMYSYYYNILSLGKDLRNTVLFNGTTACFRKSAIIKMNGFPVETFCEDIDISTRLLSAGYKTRFLNEYATLALVPWKLSTLISSIWRWAHGSTTILVKRFKEIFSSKNITIFTKIELFLNNFVWISGSALIIVSICLSLMFILDYNLIRPIYEINLLNYEFSINGFLFFSFFFGFSTILGNFIAVLSSKEVKWFIVFPAYLIASISLFFFVFPAVIRALLGFNSATDNKSKWNRELNFTFYGLFMIPFGIINFILGILAIIGENLLFLFFLPMSISLISPFIFLIFDKRTNTIDLEQEYFQRQFII